ncbi:MULTISPECIES: hypothetical protein [unclassified Curtobacterium]|uniref:hypothetical protein n=1 Tax=unclassified Curtobacterium TaxID=257496 RepID=UPI0008265AD6|nr:MULTISPECIES: hypothetical protein [unclassified Curtobacterium]WIB01264.1 hypothetical protein QOL15_06150 [Curtobacterium sp. MCBA15_012]
MPDRHQCRSRLPAPSRPPFDDVTIRQEFRARLDAIRGVDLPASRIDKRPSFPVEVFIDEHARNAVVEALRWFVDQVLDRLSEEEDAA